MMYRWRRLYRQRGSALHVLLAVALLAVAAFSASAYSDARIAAGASLVVTPSAHAQLAVETVALQLRPDAVAALDGASLDGDEAGGADEPVVRVLACGSVANNIGETVWAATAALTQAHRLSDGARDDRSADEAVVGGTVFLSASTLAPGEQVTMLCDVSGIEPGAYSWTGQVAAYWHGGRAEVPFELTVTVPEPAPLDGDKLAPEGGDSVEEATGGEEVEGGGQDETGASTADEYAGAAEQSSDDATDRQAGDAPAFGDGIPEGDDPGPGEPSGEGGADGGETETTEDDQTAGLADEPPGQAP